MKQKLPKYEGKKFNKGIATDVKDYLTIEEALQININESAFTVIMRSPGNDNDLVRGLLYNEDIYTGDSPLTLDIIKTSDLGYTTEVNVDINPDHLGEGYLSSRSMLSVSSCGICGKRELGDLSIKGKKLEGIDFSPLQIETLLDKMKKEQIGFAQSGGSHAAAIFDNELKLLTTREDIGRHNAVDKAIGFLLTESQLKTASFMVVSGRVSYEIITKTFRAKIPVLLAVSAPSSLAIDFAKELGITVFCFCRDNKATRYS